MSWHSQRRLVVVLLLVVVFILAPSCWRTEKGAFKRRRERGMESLGVIEREGEDDRVVPEKVIVMAAREEDDINWVQRDLHGWHHALYIINATHSHATISSDPSTSQSQPLAHARLHAVNQTITYLPRRHVSRTGNSALPYVIYLLTHYDRLPEVMVFLSPSRDGASSKDHDADASSVKKKRKSSNAPLPLTNVFKIHALNLQHVAQTGGFANLQCDLNQGCAGTNGRDLGAGSLRPWRKDEDLEAGTLLVESEKEEAVRDGETKMGATTSSTSDPYALESAFTSMWHHVFQGGDMRSLSGSMRARLRSFSSSSTHTLANPSWENLPSLPLPRVIGFPLGGEFVVTRERVLEKISYRRLRALAGWITESGGGDGSVWEGKGFDEGVVDMVGQYVWGILFGGEDVQCLSTSQCECDLYSVCASKERVDLR